MNFKVGDRVIVGDRYSDNYLKQAVTVSRVTAQQIRISGMSSIFNLTGSGSYEKIYMDTPEGWHRLIHDRLKRNLKEALGEKIHKMQNRALLGLLLHLEEPV